jgi:hypothetical protein
MVNAVQILTIKNGFDDDSQNGRRLHAYGHV